MNLANIKSIDEIADDLRSKGELDENKWSKAQTSIKKWKILEKFMYVVWAIIIIIDFNILTIITCSLFIYGTYKFFNFYSGIANTNFYIANYGVGTAGFVDSFEKKFFAPSFVNIIGYYFFDKDKNKYRGNESISSSNIGKIKKGIVEVWYVPENPHLNTVLIAKTKNNYDLKIKKEEICRNL